MKIILIRHGETFANTWFNTEKQILIGALDNELTQLNEHGIAQAKAAREKLKSEGLLQCVDRIYCSDITRAIKTAEIIFEGRKIHQDCRLRERSLGHLEGVPLQDVKKDPDQLKYLVSFETEPLDVCIQKKAPDGESILDVSARLTHFLSELDFEEESTIALVSHFHTLRTLLYLLQKKEIDLAYHELMIENSSPIIATYHQGYFQVEK